MCLISENIRVIAAPFLILAVRFHVFPFQVVLMYLVEMVVAVPQMAVVALSWMMEICNTNVVFYVEAVDLDYEDART